MKRLAAPREHGVGTGGWEHHDFCGTEARSLLSPLVGTSHVANTHYSSPVLNVRVLGSLATALNLTLASPLSASAHPWGEYDDLPYYEEP